MDREKVINGLECCEDLHTAGPGYAQSCAFCPYKDTPSDGACGYACFRAMTKDAIALLKAQEPQPPKHIHEEFPSHDWILDEDGEIDLFTMDCDFHNGPSCKRCGYSFCMHCNPDGFTKEPCVIDKDVCPTCGRFIFTGQNYCSSCGQAVKWE